MATYQENLVTTRDQIAASLVAMTASPKPTYSIDGESYSWQQLFDSYTNQLTKINALIAGDAPQEVVSYGVTCW